MATENGETKPLPFITEETRKVLMEEMGLDIDSKTQGIISGITGEQKNPRIILPQLASETFRDLIVINRGLVELINKELNDAGYHYSSTARAIGMGVVLRAFHVNSEFNLLPKFANLNNKELDLVRQAIVRSLPPSDSDHIPLLERLLSLPTIPEQQVNLNNIVTSTASAWVDHGYCLEGSAAMYQILSSLSYKLF